MFGIETEDMLPRAAPRPSAAAPNGMGMGGNAEIVKPTVPEVSIIFGPNAPSGIPPSNQSQQQMDTKAHPASAAQLSFASWKKQVLPRVNFSPVLTTELAPRPSHTHTHTHTHNANLPSSSSGQTVSNEYFIMPRDRIYTPTTATTPPSSGNIPVGYKENRRDADYLPRLPTVSPRVSDVLTICASTQTNAANITPPSKPAVHNGVCPDVELSQLVNKQDLAALMLLLESMREEQRQLKQLCESLVKERQAPAMIPSRTSTGCQCEIITVGNNNNVKRHTPIIQDYIIEEDEPTPTIRPPPVRALPNQFQSPRPMAQSTGYRANTPNGKILPTPHHLSKPNTEKSFVMNELALKYLRQPVDELMKEMCVSGDLPATSAPHSPMTEPLRQIDNLTHAQSPNNISNASYKYLKKYRLLPEDEMNPGSPQQDHQQQEEAMLDLENIRNQPKLL